MASDLTRREGCRQVVDEVVGRWDGVDILVNCAGAARMGDILDLSTEVIDEGLGLKSYGYLRLAQGVIPHMKRNGWGRIVNIAGGAGTSPTRANMPLSVANIAVLNMTRALSDAVSGDGILVNTICPGMTNTQRGKGPAAREGCGRRSQRGGDSGGDRTESAGGAFGRTGRDRQHGGFPGFRALLLPVRQLPLHGRGRETGDPLGRPLFFPAGPAEQRLSSPLLCLILCFLQSRMDPARLAEPGGNAGDRVGTR